MVLAQVIEQMSGALNQHRVIGSDYTRAHDSHRVLEDIGIILTINARVGELGDVTIVNLIEMGEASKNCGSRRYLFREDIARHLDSGGVATCGSIDVGEL